MQIKDPKWSKEPNKLLVEYLDRLKKGTVLDLGGSDGVNAIYLAENGFKVTSVDKDIEALEKLSKNSKEAGLDITTLEVDLNNYIVDSSVDNCISFYVFHFLDKLQGRKLIDNIQEKTNIAGLNILIGFTNIGEFKINPDKCYFEGDYLQEQYKDWDILLYKKFVGSTKSGLNQERVLLVAKKP